MRGTVVQVRADQYGLQTERPGEFLVRARPAGDETFLPASAAPKVDFERRQLCNRFAVRGRN
jgi:hypothetical protein